MKKRSIIFRLFIITLVCFTFFVGIFMAGQTLFFKKFYVNMKVSRLVKNMEAFSLRYTNENWSEPDIIQNVNKFADQNSAQIAILDKNGNTKYTPKYEVVLESDGKNRIKIPLNNIAYLDGFQNLKLAVGAEIEVEGYFSDDLSFMFSLMGIKKGEEEWKNSNVTQAIVSVSPKQAIGADDLNVTTLRPLLGTVSSEAVTSSSGEVAAISASALRIVDVADRMMLKQLHGKIIDLKVPSKIEQMTGYNSSLLWSAIDYWSWLANTGKIAMKPGKTTELQYSGFSNGTNGIILARSIITENQISGYVFAVSSLQPVGEAVDAMKDYYLYAFLVALLLIAVMSLLFSKIVSKPLIEMNRVAVKMADLDFSEECVVESRDEMGSLAVSLNRLSQNLGASLRELRAANEQLQQDIEKERSLEKMRKEFVSAVSHEFKTPLGIIKGFAEGLKDHVAEEKKDYYIDVIQDEIEKLDELVLDLLDLAKLESKAYKLNLENFCMIDLLDEVQSRLLTYMNHKNIELIFTYEHRDIEVCADRRRIEQVVTNIVSNAIRHTPKDAHIKICAEREKEELYVYIENIGKPIAEEDMPKIWDRFYRTEKSRDRKTGGTGLGLSIVKNILELHESRFGVENTNDGVRFYFTLKLSQE